MDTIIWSRKCVINIIGDTTFCKPKNVLKNYIERTEKCLFFYFRSMQYFFVI